MLDDRLAEYGLTSCLDCHMIGLDKEMFLLKRWVLSTFCVHLQHSGEDAGDEWQVCVLSFEQHQSSELNFEVTWRF